MHVVDAEVIFRPESEELRYLPEGPYPCPDGRLSWVAIQHGPQATTGSLNLLDLNSGRNTNYPLPGRPGFAFPTDRDAVYVIGLERQVVLFDCQSGSMTPISDEVDSDVAGTIINDGMVWQRQLVFGCKDLKFSDKKAGLYLLQPGQPRPIRMRNDQVCSNGKAIVRHPDGRHTLYDICSKSQQVAAWNIDLAHGTVDNRTVLVDLTNEGVFPDGMILTPDRQSLIVAIYDPREVTTGEARQYGIATGQVETVWRCEGSPRVTCPQLVPRAGVIYLVLTTADEGMPASQRAGCPNAGCLFAAPTHFATPGDAPVYPLG
jgi:sugar lactone lactonase YvrE